MLVIDGAGAVRLDEATLLRDNRRRTMDAVTLTAPPGKLSGLAD